jgi:hypothetical protein
MITIGSEFTKVLFGILNSCFLKNCRSFLIYLF